MTVLVGVSSAPEGLAALRAAVDECLARRSGLDVLSTTPRSPSASSQQQAAAEIRQDPVWAEELEKGRRRLSDAGLELIVHEVSATDRTSAMLDLADQLVTDLVVIGVRQRTPVGKLLVGSHAQRLLLEASCPVLVVKAPGRDRPE
ncbi:universal stress protein [Austwickia chelonae]|uniref:universal stress protein n=1 Tax=Austwickia chelonae TaxID=100225 RepID=UPI0013C3453E|nr:universal stress protein [Austwickia chelonae]